MADAGLAAKHCEPCRGGLPPLDRDEARALLARVPGWTLHEGPMRIARTFNFRDFLAAQAFAVKVGALSEAEGHHPDILYGWGHCTVTYWTHKIAGLHENDYIMAAKVNALEEAAVEAAIGGDI